MSARRHRVPASKYIARAQLPQDHCSGEPFSDWVKTTAPATSAQQASSRVAALAAGLTQVLGVQMGDRVCIAALGTDAHLEALLAVTAGGAIAAPLNWRWGAAEAAAAAQLVGARVLLADAACLSYALAAASAASGGILRVLVLLGSPAGYPQQDLAAAEAQGVALAFAESLIDGCPNSCLALISAPGNAALVVFTSGTTGRPKGVTLSHAALHAQSMAKLLTCGYSATDVYLHTAPLFHIGGLSSALAMLAAGARHVFLPRFDGGALLAAIRQHRVTSFIAVPTMVADLLAAASQAAVATLPSVTRILVGGGGMSHTQQTGLAALCPAATVHTAYGMTECASSLTFTTIWGPVSPSASGSLVASPISSSSAAGANAAAQDLPGGVYVGRPPPGIELAVYRPPGGAVAGAAGGGGASGARLGGVQQSGEGEVLTRGPHVMLGYWDDDEATAAAQLPGGWLRTGDLGRLSQGRLWLMGRAKDMIKSGGENVHAWEVEQALAGHPGIATAAVVGVSDWRLGEAVAAAVVLQPGWHWRGQRCQVLLAASPRQEASKAALAAAAAVVLPASQLAASSLQLGRLENGMPDGGGGGEEQALQRCSSPAAVLVEEDFRSTLLQRLPAQASSACQLSPSPSAGMLTAAVMLPSATGQAARGRHPGRLEALQQLSGVAAGLQLAAAVSERSEGDSSSQAGAQDRELDGQLLQAYCRRQGLTGFKLPRIFLLCDDSASGSAGTTLPRNSTGKVVKHLLRQQVQQHMQAGGRAGGEGGSLPRSRM